MISSTLPVTPTRKMKAKVKGTATASGVRSVVLTKCRLYSMEQFVTSSSDLLQNSPSMYSIVAAVCIYSSLFTSFSFFLFSFSVLGTHSMDLQTTDA